MPDYSSLLAAVGTGESRADLSQSRANVNFDDRIMKEALPITRMLSRDGSIDRKKIKGAGKGFTDPSTLWEDLSANMPRGRGIDPVVFQEKFQAGKSMYDMSLANQVAQMGQSGYSEKRVWNEFGANPDLRQYMVENGILQPQLKSTGGLGTAAFIGSMAALQGGRAINTLSKVPKPTPDQLSALKEAGYKYQKGGKNAGIRKMTPMEIYGRDNPNFKKEGMPKKPVKKAYKFKSGPKKGKPNTASYNKALKDYNAKIDARTKSFGEKTKAARATARARDAADKSLMGKQALKSGARGTTGKIATNVALKSVGKTLGTQVGKGLGMRALGLFGGVPGLALSGAWGIYELLSALNKNKTADTGSRWK